MKTPRRSGMAPPHRVGAGGAWRPSMGYLTLAVGILAAGLAYFWMAPPSAPDLAINPVMPPSLPATSGVVPAWPVQASSAPPEVTVHPQSGRAQVREADGNDPTPDLSAYVNPGEKPSMNEVIDRLHQAGVHTGLGAFSPPGTRPPLVGLAVPEDFVLPAGYVRHHQSTDDGQRIEAILMFAPDYQPLDANHQPIAIPKDRVVPLELAPAGLPIRRIVIPAPTDPEKSGR